MHRFLRAFIIFLFCSSLLFPLTEDDKLSDEIKSKPTFHQKVNGFTLSLSPEEMEYFLDNLPYASEILNRYQIHSLRIESVGEGSFYAEDDDGLKGTFTLLKKDGGFREFGGNGEIENRVIGLITADVIAAIHYKELTATSISSNLEFWVRVNNPFLNFLCRIFRPLLNQILKNKFDHFINVAQSFADKVRSNEEIIGHSL